MDGNPNWNPGDPCPCGNEKCPPSLKLVGKNRHHRGCVCRSCIGSRNRKRGQVGQRKTWRALGGEGVTPSNEESSPVLEVRVRPEVKRGKQANSIVRLIQLDFVRRAFNQSRKGQRTGDGTKPSVALWPEGGGGWLIVELEERHDR